MKTILSIILIFILAGAVQAQQEFSARVDEAKSAYAGGNLEDTRFALEQALYEIDKAIAQEILDMLPSSLGGLSYDESLDEVAGGTRNLGVYLNRFYPGEEKSIEIGIVNNSPLLSGLTALLSMPMIGGMGDSGQKVIKIDGYKSVLQRNEDENGEVTGYSLQIPVNDTLISVDCDGFTTESEATQIGNSLPVSEIASLVR